MKAVAKYTNCQWTLLYIERYADDIVVHCRSETQLKMVEHQIRRRFTQCRLELCQEKTKIVYCKDSNRSGHYPNQSFDFLGYTFRPRSARERNGKFFVSFSPAVSRKALKAMRAKLKGHPLMKLGYSQSIVDLAKAINPIIQGWITYYGKFRRSAMSAIYSYINEKLLSLGEAEVQIAAAPEMACQPMAARALSATSGIVCTLASLEVGG